MNTKRNQYNLLKYQCPLIRLFSERNKFKDNHDVVFYSGINTCQKSTSTLGRNYLTIYFTIDTYKCYEWTLGRGSLCQWATRPAAPGPILGGLDPFPSPTWSWGRTKTAGSSPLSRGWAARFWPQQQLLPTSHQMTPPCLAPVGGGQWGNYSDFAAPSWTFAQDPRIAKIVLDKPLPLSFLESLADSALS